MPTTGDQEKYDEMANRGNDVSRPMAFIVVVAVIAALVLTICLIYPLAIKLFGG